jgi:hypothetical protein
LQPRGRWCISTWLRRIEVTERLAVSGSGNGQATLDFRGEATLLFAL